MPADNGPFATLVVKLGGSLHASPDLARWIAALKRYPRPLTIVSGGGPFADAVRGAQPKMGFSDKTAHAMAVLAMEQYALALADIHDLDLAASLEEMAPLNAARRIALWRPSVMVARAADITPGWDVTSDSLAAWLARLLRAESLLLIKSVDVRADASLAEIATTGVVDPAFADYVRNLRVFVAGPSALAGAENKLAAGVIPGARICGEAPTINDDAPSARVKGSVRERIEDSFSRFFRILSRADRGKTRRTAIPRGEKIA